MSITATEVTSWKQDLETMIDDVTDADARAALTNLRSALEPYFETPEYFRSILGKIQMKMLSADVEAEISNRSFADLDEFKAALPDGVSVTAL
ncbi:hypothetical protein [Catellatospora tritici]|uniref:hypothetical protein n=1 Tax=Catellatospora tritici TaxID=2851566 RepID=UPI001C2D542A|nr:hypothetical protein [Catellatospora tritici]MBV1855645.1 hypothetical protein [Catellatospora tritici]